MSSIGELIETVKVSFTCPECDTRGTFELAYVALKWSRKKKKACAVSWCRCRSCKKVTELSYRIHKSMKGAFILKVLDCVSGGKRFKHKRYVVERNNCLDNLGITAQQ